MKTVTVRDLQRKIKECIDEAQRDRVIITRRGKPVAKISPLEDSPTHLGQVKGWLEDSDPFFGALEEIVSNRAQHRPRIWTNP